MLQTLFALPLAQTFVPAPSPPLFGLGGVTDPLVIGLAVVLGLILLGLTYRARRKPVVEAERQVVLVDGSNVMHWQDNAPNLEPVQMVVRTLIDEGLKPGVVFDANAGYKLVGRFLGEREFARLLSVPRDQILVVPKGTQADPFLLLSARDFGARIVTNDRFRDWAEDHPEVRKPGQLIRGGVRDGRLWLQDLTPATAGPGGVSGTPR